MLSAVDTESGRLDEGKRIFIRRHDKYTYLVTTSQQCVTIDVSVCLLSTY